MAPENVPSGFELKVENDLSSAAYSKRSSATLDHFAEKLLRLKSMMKTDMGAKLAEKRHTIMESFVKQFISEWTGEI